MPDEEAPAKPEDATPLVPPEAEPDPPPQGEQAIRDAKADHDWQQSAISGQLLDRLVKQMADLGQISVGGSAYHTYINKAEIGGNLSVGGGPDSVRAKAVIVVPQHEMRTELFIAPQGFESAAELLDRTRIIVLRGPSGSGRRTAALQLAADREGEPCYLRPDGMVAELTAESAPRVYIVPGLGPGPARGLDDFTLRSIKARLVRTRSWVVITAVPGVAIPHQIDCVDLGLPPALEVARRHGRAILTEDRYAEFDAHLTVLSTLRPQEAARIGTSIAAAVLGGTIEETVARLAADPESAARAWFDGFKDPWIQAFAIAVAVLDGAAYLNVSDAATGLYRELGSSSEGGQSFRNILDDPCFTTEAAMEETTFGVFPIQAIRYTDELIRLAVLRYVWHELDEHRDALVTWLRELGAHRNADVRARAAASAGLLALHDFPYAYGRVLEPWSGGRFVERDTAALAFSLPGTEASLADQVWTLLLGWCGEGNRARASTAMAAFAGPLGSLAPHRAMDGLRTAAGRSGWARFPELARSVFLLLQAGHTEAVLNGLKSWPDEDGIGLSVFLFCAGMLDASGRPVLMSGARPSDLAELWGRSIGKRAIVRNYGLEVIRDWCRYADTDVVARPLVLELLVHMADLSELQRRRLEFHLHKWAVEPSATAELAFRTIMEGGSR